MARRPAKKKQRSKPKAPKAAKGRKRNLGGDEIGWDKEEIQIAYVEDEISYDFEDSGDYNSRFASKGWPQRQRVSDLRDTARARASKITKAGEQLTPVTANGRKIANTFWGQAWCRNLEAHHDYESRLPRGRSYLRNGSVIDLKISRGKVTALVSGQELYQVEITFETLKPAKWNGIVEECAGSVGSVIELMSGKISDSVMAVITDDKRGLFPKANEFTMSCTCPDWATMCKHVAATLYGVGARLDDKPELFFVLRGVDHSDLINRSAKNFAEQIDVSEIKFNQKELENLFGIEITL